MLNFHIHRLLTGVFLGFAALIAVADQNESATPNLDQLGQSEEILKDPAKFLEGIERFRTHTAPENLPDDAQKLAREISTQSRNAASNAASKMEHTPGELDFTFGHDDTPPPENQPNAFGPDPQQQDDQISKLLPEQGETRYVMYLSFAMPDPVLKQALLAIKDRDDAVGVIQGLLAKDHSIPQTMLAIREKLESFDIDAENAPSIYIDSELFSHFGVTNVPTLTRFDGEDPVISIKGLPSIKHLDRRYDEGERGPVGVLGSLYDIGEENFIAMIERRASEIDGEKMADKALDNFWHKQAMHPLPMATETNSYLIDLTIEANRDIQTPEGNYIVRAGDRVNPLDQVPFNQVGIIFDGNDQQQLDWAIREAETAMSKNQVPIMMTTHIDYSDDGWEAYKRINEQFPMGLKMINQAIINRFDIQHAPSKFEQHGRHIKVTEVALNAPETQ